MNYQASQTLTNDQLYRLAPSIFATEPDHEVSDRYNFVPTIEVIDSLRRFDWFPVSAQQQKVRHESRNDVAKHIIKFRSPNVAPVSVRGNDPIQPEIIVTNSHDRSSAFQLLAGLIRFACSNGLIVSDAMFAKVSVRHDNASIEHMITNAIQLTETVPQITSRIEEFGKIELSSREQEAFARSALHYRYDVHGAEGERPKIAYRHPNRLVALQRQVRNEGGDPDAVVFVPIEPVQLLEAQRASDMANPDRFSRYHKGQNVARNDLWTTYNVIQENLTKGGVRGTSQTGRRMTTRKINSIDGDIKLNRALWSMAEFLSEHVG